MVQSLSIIGALIGIGGMAQYIGYLVTNKIILNKVTWGISAAIMLLQAGTYFEIVRAGNPWIATNSIIVAVGFMFIFIYSFIYGRYAKLNGVDWVSLAVGIATVVIWKFTGNAKAANLILQTAVVVSFIPTIVGLFQGRLREKPWPWFIGVISYVFIIVAIFLQYGFSNLAAFVYPILIGILINGFIGLQAVGQNLGYLPTPVLNKK